MLSDCPLLPHPMYADNGVLAVSVTPAAMFSW